MLIKFEGNLETYLQSTKYLVQTGINRLKRARRHLYWPILLAHHTCTKDAEAVPVPRTSRNIFSHLQQTWTFETVNSSNMKIFILRFHKVLKYFRECRCIYLRVQVSVHFCVFNFSTNPVCLVILNENYTRLSDLYEKLFWLINVITSMSTTADVEKINLTGQSLYEFIAHSIKTLSSPELVNTLSVDFYKWLTASSLVNLSGGIKNYFNYITEVRNFRET